MEGSRIAGIFVLLAIAVALTVAVFGRKRGNSGNIPAPTRAPYTLMPPFANIDDALPPPPPKMGGSGSGCGCQAQHGTRRLTPN